MLPRKAAGHSIPASEHSTITSWGVNGEVDAMTNMLLSYPTGLVACVSQRKKHTRTKPSYFELQVVCFCFQCFPFASPDDYFQVSDSFDVFKACKDGENSKKCQIFWSWVDTWYWFGGWCGRWWNPLGGLLGRQVEGYDQRFTTQMMTPRGKGLHKWNSKSWTIAIIPSTSTATYKLEGSQVCERNLAKRQEVTWYQYHFVKTFFGDKNTTGRITGDSFGRLVVRPDSGDPADTCKVCRVNFLKKQRPKIEKFWKNYWSWWVFLCALKCHFLRAIFCTL